MDDFSVGLFRPIFNLACATAFWCVLSTNCTFPENTEPAATGQGVVRPDFRRRQVSGPAGPGEDRRGKPPARWTVCLRPNGSSDSPESSEE